MRVERSNDIGVPIESKHVFLVGQDGEGHWLAIETHGLGGGLFVTRDAALHYARAETDRRPGAVILAEAPVVIMAGAYGRRM